MMKATLRGAVLLGLLAMSVPAFAEVQNVKVGGDITVRAFHRENLDLSEDDGDLNDNDNFFMTTTGLNVGADLTENVSTFVRLANERDWATDANPNENGDFDVSQAYITLKELFYSPLTLRVGTQPIVWGRGFVLGSGLLPNIINGTDDRNTAISANEFTDFTAFDAIRATLDLSNLGGMTLPLTADYVYIKLDENGTGSADDVTLQGVNFSTKFDQANSELEFYYLNKRDESDTTVPDDDGTVSTFGIRGSAAPAEGLSIWSELAYQFGSRATDSDAVLSVGSGHQAWAVDLGIEQTFTNVAMTPKLGGEWVFWSGNECDNQVGSTFTSSACGGWDPLARGYFTTALREFQTNTNTAFYNTVQAGDTAGATNEHQFSFWGGLKPVEDLSALSRLTFFVLDKQTTQGATVGGGENTRRRYAGTEWDNQLTYNYTDDVTLGFLYGIFWPGTVYEDVNDSTAQELVTTVSVKF